MQIPIWKVDAFAARPFAGNPAAVCPLEEWIPDELMQAIAAENNLSETAFFVRRDADFDLRWFTPVVEVELCGHATLASAWVLLHEIDPSRTHVVFHTKSGPLTVVRAGDELAMDLPARPLPRPVETPDALVRALGRRPASTMRSRDLVAVFDRAEDVRALVPDMTAVASLEGISAVSVTAPGTGPDADVDFVSRFFAPAKGIAEDPVTGGAHTTLVPYWAERLGKDALRARQVSARGGELGCKLQRQGQPQRDAERVTLTGRAVTVLRGTMHV
jgi:PhzF family phenazine biosynthesis protein